MLLSHRQNEGQNHDVKIVNSSFENVAQFKRLGRTVRNQNFIQEEIKRKLNLDNACYHSFQNLLSYHLPSKNITIRVHRTIILPVVLYVCATWSLTLREVNKLRMFEKRVLRKISRPKRDEVTGGWKNCIMRSFITCTLHQV
jgi:hypothetical protein